MNWCVADELVRDVGSEFEGDILGNRGVHERVQWLQEVKRIFCIDVKGNDGEACHKCHEVRIAGQALDGAFRNRGRRRLQIRQSSW